MHETICLVCPKAILSVDVVYSHVQGHVVATKWEDLVKWRLTNAPLLTLEGDDIRKGQR